MRYTRFLSNNWKPSFVKHLPDIVSPSPPKAIEKTRRQHIPLSLKAREELAKRSNDYQYHVVTQDWFGQRVDDFVLQHHVEWSYETVKRLVENGSIYRYRKNGKKRFTRLTDRLEFDELVVVPTQAFWQRELAPPQYH